MKVQESKLTFPIWIGMEALNFLNSIQIKNYDDSRLEPDHSCALDMPRCKKRGAKLWARANFNREDGSLFVKQRRRNGCSTTSSNFSLNN